MGRALTLLRLKEGISGLMAQSNLDPSHFSPQDASGSSLPKPSDYLLAQDLNWELLASGMAVLPGSRRDQGWWRWGDLIGQIFTALSLQELEM